MVNYLKQSEHKQSLLLLLLIMLLGAFLRFYDLGAESIWYDEASAINLSLQNLSTVLRDCATTQTHPPLYFILLHYWIKLFGISEIATRSLSAIFGVMSVWVIYGVGSSLYNRKVGILASFILATSFFNIAYSQEVRSYSLLLLLSLLSYYSFIKIIQENKKGWYLAYLISGVFLGYTHVYGFFIIASQALLFIFLWNECRETRCKFIITLAATLLTLSPLTFLLSGHITHLVTEGFWIPEPSVIDIFRTLVAFSAYWGRDVAKLIVVVFVPLAIIGVFTIKKMSGGWNWKHPISGMKGLRWEVSLEQFEGSLLLLVWLFVPILLAFIQSNLMTPTYQIRYLIGASPALYLLVAKGITRISKKSLFYTTLAFIMIMSSVGLYYYYVDQFKFPWRNVAGFVEANATANDVIVVNSPPNGEPFTYHYHGRAEAYTIPWELPDSTDKCQYVKDISRYKERIWIVAGARGLEEIYNCIKEEYGNALDTSRRDFDIISVLAVELRK